MQLYCPACILYSEQILHYFSFFAYFTFRPYSDIYTCNYAILGFSTKTAYIFYIFLSYEGFKIYPIMQDR